MLSIQRLWLTTRNCRTSLKESRFPTIPAIELDAPCTSFPRKYESRKSRREAGASALRGMTESRFPFHIVQTEVFGIPKPS